MSGPFFSIILPAYNRARMLRTALSTVQYQTFGEWECLVVDDGSTDDTKDVLLRFQGEPRIRVLFNAANKGMNASRNLAIKEARGRFVTFLDSDDLWLPHRLEAFRVRMAASPDAGFVFSNAYVWRFGRVVGTLFDPARVIPEGVVPGYYAVGDRQLPYVTTNVAIRREAFDRWGLFKTQMRTLDTELFARFIREGLPVAAIKEPLSVRRIHGGQLTERHAENFRESLLALESSGASASLRAAMRESICREVAVYMLKAGRPAQAREFLLEALGAAARRTLLFRATFIPGWALASARQLRRAWLMLRHHPAWACGEIGKINALVAPLLAAEQND
ncbi:MAG: glycosyltransferase family A protein [Elusimicrobia bacterium]|nr:glycosyltransferase family A protein [Elusimicrobiota bacterium]